MLHKRFRHLPKLRVWLIALVIIVLIGGMIQLYVRRQASERVYSFDDYQAFKEAGDYAAAVEYYNDIQAAFATDGDRAKKNLLEKIEQDVRSESLDILQKLYDGGRLSDKEERALAYAVKLAGNEMVAFLYESCYDYLGGRYDEASYVNLINESLRIPEVRRMTDELATQHAAVRQARERVEKPVELFDKGDYPAAIEAFNTLASDESLRTCLPVRRFLETMTERSETALYRDLMPQIESFMHQRRTYDAEELIRTLVPYFPTDKALLDLQRQATAANPERTTIWRDAFCVIAVKPLVEQPSEYTGSDHDDRMTGEEFDALLDRLYRAGFVLVDAAETVDEKGSFRAFTVPADKTPFVFLVEDFNMDEARSSGGIAGLVPAKDGTINGTFSIPFLSDGPFEERPLGAPARLERFVANHPDFAFNGARGVLAMSFQNGALGFPLTSEQATLQFNRLQRMGADLPGECPDNVTITSRLNRLLDRLSDCGWHIAAQGFTRPSVPDLSLEELKEELHKMATLPAPFNQLDIFCYANGNHALSMPEKTTQLAEGGFHLHIGGGATHAYMTGGEGFLYVVRFLMTPESSALPLP